MLNIFELNKCFITSQLLVVIMVHIKILYYLNEASHCISFLLLFNKYRRVFQKGLPSSTE